MLALVLLTKGRHSKGQLPSGRQRKDLQRKGRHSKGQLRQPVQAQSLALPGRI
jgi:hypothetical protein